MIPILIFCLELMDCFQVSQNFVNIILFNVKSNLAPILINSHCISTVQEDLAFTRSGNLFNLIGGVSLGSTYENIKVLTTGWCFNYKTYISVDFC